MTDLFPNFHTTPSIFSVIDLIFLEIILSSRFFLGHIVQITVEITTDLQTDDRPVAIVKCGYKLIDNC